MASGEVAIGALTTALGFLLALSIGQTRQGACCRNSRELQVRLQLLSFLGLLLWGIYTSLHPFCTTPGRPRPGAAKSALPSGSGVRHACILICCMHCWAALHDCAAVYAPIPMCWHPCSTGTCPDQHACVRAAAWVAAPSGAAADCCLARPAHALPSCADDGTN